MTANLIIKKLENYLNKLFFINTRSFFQLKFFKLEYKSFLMSAAPTFIELPSLYSELRMQIYLNEVNKQYGFLKEIAPELYNDYALLMYPSFIEVEEFQHSNVAAAHLQEEYFQIILFAYFGIFLSIVIVGASYILVTQKPESEKLSTYECGFEPYEDARNRFDVQFYVVAILFVLFDIEIIVLLPWCLSLSTSSLLGYWSMIEFILELGLGFVYVWNVGALDW